MRIYCCSVVALCVVYGVMLNDGDEDEDDFVAAVHQASLPAAAHCMYVCTKKTRNKRGTINLLPVRTTYVQDKYSISAISVYHRARCVKAPATKYHVCMYI